MIGMQPRRNHSEHAASGIATAAHDSMFTATPGFTPNTLRRSTYSINKGSNLDMHTAASAFVDPADKENYFVPTMAERIKDRRQAATNMFPPIAPSKKQLNTLPSSKATNSTLTTFTSSPPQRELSIGSMQPPPPKRARRESKDDEPNTRDDTQLQNGNIAARLQSALDGIDCPNPFRVHPGTPQISPRYQRSSFGSQAPSPHNVLPPLSSGRAANNAMPNGHAHVHVQPRPQASNVRLPQLEPVFDKYGNEVGHMIPKRRSLPTWRDSPTTHAYRPDLYAPSTMRQRIPALGVDTQSSASNPDVEEWCPTVPSTYPVPRAQPNDGLWQPQTQQAEAQNKQSLRSDEMFAPAGRSASAAQPQLSDDYTAFSSGIDSAPKAVNSIPNPISHHADPSCDQRSSTFPVHTAQWRSGGKFETLSDGQTSYIGTTNAETQTPSSETMSLMHRKLSLRAAQPSKELQDAAIKPPNTLIHSSAGIQYFEPSTSMAPKRRRADSLPQEHTTVPSSIKPVSFAQSDQNFVTQVLTDLKRLKERRKETFGKRQAGRIYEVLSKANPPHNTEALFLSGDEAAKHLEPNAYFSGPIITDNQQPRPLQSTTEFLAEFYDDSAQVSIQDAGRASDDEGYAVRDVTIGRLKQRFQQEPKAAQKDGAWNCLELATHVEDGLRPGFLADEDTRLLTKLKHPNSEDKASRRGYDPGWKEVEKWALLAQAGALTEPHQDSHGYSTYITVNQGVVGFGFLANPSAAERAEWCASPSTFTGGQWRYVILRPGQTVFFPGGTVHFVFRLAALGDTLAFGGHVLRCSQIVRWVKALLEEQAYPEIVNEDLTVSAPAYLERVEKFVRQALESGRVEIWGGRENIEEFLRLKAEFFASKKGAKAESEGPTVVVEKAKASKKKKS